MKKTIPFLIVIAVVLFSFTSCSDNALRHQLTETQSQLALYKDSVNILRGAQKPPAPLTVTDPDGNVVIVKDTVAYHTYLASCKTADSLFDAVLDRSEFDKYYKLLSSQYEKDDRQKARTFATFIAKYPNVYPLMLSALAGNVIDNYTAPEEIDAQMNLLYGDSTIRAINSYESPNIAHYNNVQYDIIAKTLRNTKTPLRQIAWSAFARKNQ